MNDVTKIENELEVDSLNVKFDLPNNQIEYQAKNADFHYNS